MQISKFSMARQLSRVLSIYSNAIASTFVSELAVTMVSYVLWYASQA